MIVAYGLISRELYRGIRFELDIKGEAAGEGMGSWGPAQSCGARLRSAPPAWGTQQGRERAPRAASPPDTCHSGEAVLLSAWHCTGPGGAMGLGT